MRLTYYYFLSLPGMYERTLTVSSAGKTFSVTGWKIGWGVGPKHLIKCLNMAHQWTVFSTCTPLQSAMTNVLTEADEQYTAAAAAAADGNAVAETHATFYDYFRKEYARKRRLLCDGLTAAGIKVRGAMPCDAIL
jgi:kynurenine--oxoglutarate transaminase/cysteine-S-conjugate beta-lyase/glutamine--phenylpyruvate transaminase